jgi:hypothetical protein
MKPEDRRGRGGLGNGGEGHGGGGPEARDVYAPIKHPTGPVSCILHIPRFNALNREKSGVPGLNRLNPTKAMVQRGTTLAATRGRPAWEPSLSATLDALFVRTRGAASGPHGPRVRVVQQVIPAALEPDSRGDSQNLLDVSQCGHRRFAG